MCWKTSPKRLFGTALSAAVLAEIASEVYTVERIERLANTAAEVLTSLDYHNVHVLCGDGTRGWLEQAPFDAIVVAAGGPRVPESLKSQPGLPWMRCRGGR